MENGLATFDDVKQYLKAFNVAYKDLQSAIEAEAAALEDEQILKNKPHIRYRAYKNKRAREYLAKKVNLHKEASKNHFIKHSELKECVKLYAGVPTFCHGDKMILDDGQNFIDIIFSLFPLDPHKGHYRVNLISGEIVHLREYGNPVTTGKTVKATK